MTPETTLPVIAQIAATFIGFTALVSVVDRSTGGKWSRISIWRIVMMLRLSITLMLMCLVPSLLFGFEIETTRVWLLALSLGIFSGLYSFYSTFQSTKILKAEGGVPLNEKVRKMNIYLGLASLAAQGTALSGLTSMSLAGVYLFAMTVNLLMISMIFFALIQQLDLQRLESDNSAGNS